MSNIFTNNPIKINIIDINKTITKTLIFLGTIPDNVNNEIMKIGKSKYNEIIIQKFYGKNWKMILCINKSGGDDNDAATQDDNATATQDDNAAASDFDEFNFDNKQLKDDTIHKKLKPGKKDKPDIQANTNQYTLLKANSIDDYENKVNYITNKDISIYPEDNILDLKKKLFYFLGISIFKQHIWFSYQKKNIALYYSVLLNNEIFNVSVDDILNNDILKKIENIPINNYFYQNKNFIKIKAYDTFSTLEEIYHKYGVTEYNLLDLDLFIKQQDSKVATIDNFQLELIYYGFIIIYWPMLSYNAFYEYMNNKDNFHVYFPNIEPNINILFEKYKLEKNIIDIKYDLINNKESINKLKKIKDLLNISITHSIISVLSYGNSKDKIISLRNLFDILQLSDTIIACKYVFNYNGKLFTIHKVFKNNKKIKDIINVESLIIKIKINTETLEYLNIVLYNNGNYIIKSHWREEYYYNFDDIYRESMKYSIDIINHINSLKNNVIVNGKTLPLLTKQNSVISEINININYNKSINNEEFDILKSVLSDFHKAGIVNIKTLENINILEYYFIKGMYQFDAERIEKSIVINNYYNYLIDGVIQNKWTTIFEQNRVVKITHRYADIKFEINGIKYSEFFTFFNFILTLFDIYQSQIIKTPSIVSNVDLHNNINKKKLKNLKEQDPVLYNFKKYYKTENVYSKICQKPYQPLMINKEAYDLLPADKKKNTIKYWNFTTNKDTFYTCPNLKYPYVKFIVNRHPKNFCIPCCKKTQILENTKEARKLIYDICIKDHIYTKKEKVITLGSRYISSYGKYTESGRISKLPENTLESLFYETFSNISNGIDNECTLKSGYYIFGVEQIYNSINNGVLYSLAHATDNNIIDLINKFINLIKSDPSKFNILLDGEIYKYFNNYNIFIDIIIDTFISNSLQEPNNIPWNFIFINMSFIYMDIIFTVFDDNKNTVNLILPDYITDEKYYMTQTHNHIILIKQNNFYNPIYLLDTDEFFKFKIFTLKVFNEKHNIIQIISNLISASNKKNKKLVSEFNIQTIEKFIKTKKISIETVYINQLNMVYYICLKDNKTYIYLPIELSFYTSKEYKISYDLINRKLTKCSIDILVNFIKTFNQWINTSNLVLEYPLLEIEKWICLSKYEKDINDNSVIIGFIYNNLHFYCSDITLKKALLIQNCPIFPIFYDPDDINKVIYNKEYPTKNTLTKNISKSIYNTNIYKLILLEFMTYFNKQKNNELRKKIKKYLLISLDKNSNDINKYLTELINIPDDVDKLNIQILDYYQNHNDKVILFNEIDNISYKFDQETLEYLKKLKNHKSIVSELTKISNNLFTFGDINKLKNFEFPNMFAACGTNIKSNSNNENSYCNKNKLIIEKKTLYNMLNIFAADIMNPVKEKWLFSNILIDNVISYFKFIKRIDEHIYIDI